MIEEKPKNPRALRTFHNRQPKEFENIKRAMFIKGSKSSQIVTDTMKELASLKKPDVVKYNNKKKNKYPSPFESETTFEFLSNKSDCSLFMFGSHSKKRPHNLVMGRLFNHHILDMIELGVENFKPMVDFRAQKNAIGSKPCFIISGSHFENNEVMKMTANMFVDFFRGKVVDAINLTGIDHVIALTAKNEKSFHFRHYAIEFKKSGDRVPNVELVEIGPSIDFNIRRNQFAEGDLRKQTNPPKIKKKKNVKTNELKESISNVHIPSQKIEDVNKTVFRTKALKRKRIGENNNLEGVDTEYDEGSDEVPEDMEVETTPAPPSKKRKRNSDV